MITTITDLEEVKSFFISLIEEENLNFHPDEDFNNYINLDSKLPTYTDEEAMRLNGLLEKCFEICEKERIDIYNLSMEIFLKKTGLDKFIPLPSSIYVI